MISRLCAAVVTALLFCGGCGGDEHAIEFEGEQVGVSLIHAQELAVDDASSGPRFVESQSDLDALLEDVPMDGVLGDTDFEQHRLLVIAANHGTGCRPIEVAASATSPDELDIVVTVENECNEEVGGSWIVLELDRREWPERPLVALDVAFVPE